MTTVALITGITGQDGSYLAELLLEKGYDVHGTTRQSVPHLPNSIAHLRGRVTLHQLDLLDGDVLVRLIRKIRPCEIYNLAGPSFVPRSRDHVSSSVETIVIGVARLLEAIRDVQPRTRFFQASSSEMLGTAIESPQSESTPFSPRCPYGAAKLCAHHILSDFRTRHQMFACSGILFNHESPRRDKKFVTRKISDTVARIKLGLERELRLGDLCARRDWGFAEDYVRAMWMMLQHDRPDDYVIATGETHLVREFVEMAFERVDLDWRDHVVVDPQFLRPADVNLLCGDASKAAANLGWRPATSFPELVAMMVDADLTRWDARGGNSLLRKRPNDMLRLRSA